MDAAALAKSALQLIEGAAKTVGTLIPDAAVKIIAGLLVDATEIAINAIDNAQLTEDAALARFKDTLTAAMALVDAKQAANADQRAKADQMIEDAAPVDPSPVEPNPVQLAGPPIDTNTDGQP